MNRDVLCGAQDKVLRDRVFIRIESFTKIKRTQLLVEHRRLAQSGIGVTGLYAERYTNGVVDQQEDCPGREEPN